MCDTAEVQKPSQTKGQASVEMREINCFTHQQRNTYNYILKQDSITVSFIGDIRDTDVYEW